MSAAVLPPASRRRGNKELVTLKVERNAVRAPIWFPRPGVPVQLALDAPGLPFLGDRIRIDALNGTLTTADLVVFTHLCSWYLARRPSDRRIEVSVSEVARWLGARSIGGEQRRMARECLGRLLGATVTYPQTGSFYTGSSGTTGCASDGSDFSPSPPPSCGCTPSCGGKQCGDDGCGSVCGTCAANSTCNASSQCMPNSTGNPDGGGSGGNPDGGDPIVDTTMVDASGCSCDVGQSRGSGAATLGSSLVLLGFATLRRRARQKSV